MIPRKTVLWATLALLTTFSWTYAQRDGDQPREGQRGPRDGQREGRGPRDGDREGRGPREGDRPPGRGFSGPPNPLVEAIDTDGDGDISPEELKNAVAALKALDKDKNGTLDRQEMRPDFSRFGGPGRGPREGAGRPGDAGPPRERGDRPRPEGDRPRGEGDRPRPEGDRPRGEGDRPRGARPGGGEGERGPGGRGPGGGPEGFVSRLMEFDADKDGKLSREELAKAAEQMSSGRGRFGGGPGGGRPGGPGGNRPARPERPE